MSQRYLADTFPSIPKAVREGPPKGMPSRDRLLVSIS